MPDSPRLELSDDTATVAELRQIMREFVAQRSWEIFHNAKNLSMSLAIETGELQEHFQWLTTEQVVRGEGFDRQAVADEMADVACYLLSFANALELDLSAAIVRKMAKNRQKYPPPTPE